MTEHNTSGGLTYRDAGVDIDAGNTLVERIKPAIKRTHRPGVIGGLGGFGGLFELPTDRYRQPVLVSGADGVGTKLRLALQSGLHDGVGIDLVAMCVNDIVVTGAEPLYFLDYYATGKLEVDVASRVISGIARGCELAGAALIGGETAEMPDMYHGDDYDLAGFAVGVVEKSKIISGEQIQAGQVIIGLPSSGVHSNGFSLVRKVLSLSGESLDSPLEGKTLAEHLMAPTVIYVKALLALIEALPVHGLAHITGGGLTENIPRVMPKGTVAELKLSSWQQPLIFDWLQRHGRIQAAEMRRTFNCGIGMVAIVDQTDADQALRTLQQAGIDGVVIGQINAAAEPGAAPEVAYS